MSAAAIIEELLEYFEDRADASMEPGEDRFHCNKEMALLQEVQKLSGYISDGIGWIPVAERLPAEGERQVLAVNSAGYFACVTTIYKNTDGQYDGEDATPEETTDPIGDITHWMPLPEGPK